MKSSTDQPQSDQHQFFQDSSLVTQMPLEQHGKEPETVSPKADQKIALPVKPVLAQLDSQGGIRINITIPASADAGPFLGKGGFGAVYEGIYNHKPVAIKSLYRTFNRGQP